MKKNYLSTLLAVLILAAIPGMAQSALVTNTFIATVAEGPLAGQFGTGSFTYNNDLLINGEEEIDPTEGLLVSFSFDGQNFDQTNDVDFDESPLLMFSNFIPDILDYILAEDENGVNFNNPLLVEIGLGELSPSSDNYDFETELSTYLVPIPGALWLFGSGIAGLAALRIRRRNKA
jgi:hypothetical protein